MSPVGGNAASSSFEVDQFDTPSGGGGGAEGMSSHTPGVTYQWEKSDDGGVNSGVQLLVEQHLRHIQQDLQHMQMIIMISIVVLSVQSVLLVLQQPMQLY